MTLGAEYLIQEIFPLFDSSFLPQALVDRGFHEAPWGSAIISDIPVRCQVDAGELCASYPTIPNVGHETKGSPRKKKATPYLWTCQVHLKRNCGACDRDRDRWADWGLRSIGWSRARSGRSSYRVFRLNSARPLRGLTEIKVKRGHSVTRDPRFGPTETLTKHADTNAFNDTLDMKRHRDLVEAQMAFLEPFVRELWERELHAGGWLRNTTLSLRALEISFDFPDLPEVRQRLQHHFFRRYPVSVFDPKREGLFKIHAADASTTRKRKRRRGSRRAAHRGLCHCAACHDKAASAVFVHAYIKKPNGESGKSFIRVEFRYQGASMSAVLRRDGLDRVLLDESDETFKQGPGRDRGDGVIEPDWFDDFAERLGVPKLRAIVERLCTDAHVRLERLLSPVFVNESLGLGAFFVLNALMPQPAFLFKSLDPEGRVLRTSYPEDAALKRACERGLLRRLREHPDGREASRSGLYVVNDAFLPVLGSLRHDGQPTPRGKALLALFSAIECWSTPKGFVRRRPVTIATISGAIRKFKGLSGDVSPASGDLIDRLRFQIKKIPSHERSIVREEIRKLADELENLDVEALVKRRVAPLQSPAIEEASGSRALVAPVGGRSKPRRRAKPSHLRRRRRLRPRVHRPKTNIRAKDEARLSLPRAPP